MTRPGGGWEGSGLGLASGPRPVAEDRRRARRVLEAVPLDLVVLNDVPAGLAARAVTEGQRIYCADAEAEHAFRRDRQLRAADLAPFLRRMAAIKREALRR